MLNERKPLINIGSGTLYSLTQEGRFVELAHVVDVTMELNAALEESARAAEEASIALADFNEVTIPLRVKGHGHERMIKFLKRRDRLAHIMLHTKRRRIRKKCAKGLGIYG